MATLDLQDAYLSVPVHHSCRKFLRFSFQGIIYEFKALPFGLALAPYVFTKILKPVLSYLREREFLSVNYLDDFLLFGNNVKECNINSKSTIHILSSLGFLINEEKCQLVPSQKIKFLGFILDSHNMSIILPNDKRLALKKRVELFANKSVCKIRNFASLIGSLVSVCRAILYGKVYIRDLEREKFYAIEKSNDNYDANMHLSKYSDYDWWIKKLSLPVIGRPLIRKLFEHEIFSDASLSGWGACMGNQRSHGWWSDNEKLEHINYLELRAVYYALRCFAGDLHSVDIVLRIDNTTAISYINKMGSIKYPKLSSLAKSIWQWCERRDIFCSHPT